MVYRADPGWSQAATTYPWLAKNSVQICILSLGRNLPRSERSLKRILQIRRHQVEAGKATQDHRFAPWIFLQLKIIPLLFQLLGLLQERRVPLAIINRKHCGASF